MTFASDVDAVITAARASSEFSLSRAQECAALAPIVAQLRAMPRPAAVAYIRETYRGAGTFDAVAVAMFKGGQDGQS